jgi:hypothetical protein
MRENAHEMRGKLADVPGPTLESWPKPRSEPFRQFVIPGFPFGVGKSRKHPRRRFPGDFPLGVEVPHRLARPLEFPKDLGQKVGSRSACGAIFDPLIFDIHPEPKHLGHAEFHSYRPKKDGRSLLILN